MTEPPLSRFAGQNPKPRPTGTSLSQAEIFTVEPSPTQDEVWHVAVFESGAGGAAS